MVDESLEEVVGVGGFLTTGPILDPLELLRLAGTRLRALVGVVVEVVVLFCSTKGFFGDAIDVAGLIGIFLTVLVDTALLRDDRELLKLVRELLRSTSSRRFGNALGRLKVCCDVSGLRSEAVRLGVDVALFDPVSGAETRSERLLSSDC